MPSEKEQKLRKEIKGELTANPVERYPDTDPKNVKKVLNELG